MAIPKWKRITVSIGAKDVDRIDKLFGYLYNDGMFGQANIIRLALKNTLIEWRRKMIQSGWRKTPYKKRKVKNKPFTVMCSPKPGNFFKVGWSVWRRYETLARAEQGLKNLNSKYDKFFDYKLGDIRA